MGCGASKSANVNSDATTTDELQTMVSSVTQIRDIAPAEVADTGAHPPRRADPMPRKLYSEAVLILTLPGVVPDSSIENEDGKQVSNAGRGESLIKRHPPKKPQRLDDSDIFKIKPLEAEELEQ